MNGHCSVLLILLLILSACFAQSTQSTESITQSNEIESITQSNESTTLYTPSSDPPYPSSGQPPIVTGISGCTYVAQVQTINCPRPATLTLTGSGFLTGIEDVIYPSQKLVVMIQGEQLKSILNCVLDDCVNDTMIVCTIIGTGYGTIPSAMLFDVQLYNLVTHAYDILENAMSFAEEHAPRVDRVSGCPIVSSDGRSMSECDILNDQITLHGSGFLSVDHSYSSVSLGSSTKQIWMFQDQTLIVRYTDDQIVFHFGTSALFIPALEAQSGSLRFQMMDAADYRRWSTEPVYLTFKSLPPPLITSVVKLSTTQGCNVDNSTGQSRFRDCIAGLSALQVNGNYFFAGLSVMLGDQPCRVISGTSSSIYVYLPVFRFIEGMFYDLSVQTVVGTAVYRSVVEFNTDPVITSVVPCLDDGFGFGPSIYARCQVNETLTLKMLNVKRTEVPKIMFVSASSPSQQIECLHVQLIDQETISCVMPDEQIGTEWMFVNVYVEWFDQSRTSNVLVNRLWDPLSAPRITRLSGCYSDSNNDLYVNQCLGQPQSPIIMTISGVRLHFPDYPNFPPIVHINTYHDCSQVHVVNANTLTCLLPMIDEMINSQSLTFDKKYSVIVQGQSKQGWMSSNAGYVTFVPYETHRTNDSSNTASTSTSTIVLATIFSVLGALLLVLCFVKICCKNLVKKVSGHLFRSADGDERETLDHQSRSDQHVELADVE